jgi:tetratricopeptide (TPR) repeat protein
VALSRLHLRMGRLELALEHAQEAARQQPTQLAPRLALVRALVASRDLSRARKELSVLAERFPDLPAVHVEVGRLAQLRGEIEPARRSFQQALEFEPASMDALSGLVTLEVGSRRFKDALARLEPRLKERPDDPNLLLLAAGVHAAAGEPRRAESMLRRVVAAHPSNLEAYSALARLYLAERRLADARREFEALAARQPRPVGALTMVGLLLLAEGDQENSRRRFEQALSIDPRAAIAANNLAWIYAESGERLDEALRLAQTAYEQLPDVPQISHTLGWVYYQRNLPALAIPLLEQSAGRDPNNPTYQFHLGLAYAKGGDGDRARHRLQRALSLSNDFKGADDARTLLATLQEGD